jgi:hypothetical protein
MTICRSIRDKIYDSIGEESMPFLVHLEISLHLLFCSRCTEELKNLEAVQDLMRNGFLPPAPGMGDAIMAKLLENTGAWEPAGISADEEHPFIDDPPVHSEFSTSPPFHSWVIIGIIILISLSTVFFGMDFENIARSQGSSFLIPVGITIGVVLTCYGALFIASHLKELSDRFGLH